MKGCGVLLAEPHHETSRLGIVERRGDGIDLGAGALRQGRDAADGRVAFGQLVELFPGRRPTASDVGVVGLDVLRRRRGAVGHDHHADGHRGSPASDRGLGLGPVHGRVRVDQLDDAFQRLGVGLGQHAVAQVEHVPAATAGVAPATSQHVAHRGLGRTPARRHDGGIQVALQPDVGGHPAPSSVERGAPVHADHLGAGRGDHVEQLGGVHPEVDAWDAGIGERRQHLGARRQHEALVVLRAERAGPRVEQLQRRGPGIQLGPQRVDRQVGQCVHQVEPERLVGVHQGLGAHVGARRATLEQVARHRERGAGERDERHGQLGDQVADRLQHVGRVGLGVEGPQTRQVLATRERPGDHRADPGFDVDAEPDGVHRGHDVGVQDRGVHPVAAHGLQRDLGGQVGIRDGPQDRAGTTDRCGTRAAIDRPGA